MIGDRRPGVGQRGLPGLDYDRLWSRRLSRTTDPLDDPDGCPDCAGTGINIMSANPAAGCGTCDGTGWRP